MARLDAFPNLTVKKIPQAVLHKCEWGQDDYSLNIANLPQRAGTGARAAGVRRHRTPKHARKRASANRDNA